MSNGNEKYVNYYVEILSSTLNDAFLRNISLQANAKISEDMLQELKNEIIFLQESNKRLDLERNESIDLREKELLAQLDELKNNQTGDVQKYIEEIAALKNTNSMHLNAISELQTKINALNQSKVEYDNTKHQLAHLDTFRSELIKTQKELETYKDSYKNLETVKNQLSKLQYEFDQKDNLIADLKKQVEHLQLTPAKRKKVESEKVNTLFKSNSNNNKVDTMSVIEDGGSF